MARGSPSDGLTQRSFKYEAARFMRWRKKQKKKKAEGEVTVIGARPT
jgi:hypothetical protein